MHLIKTSLISVFVFYTAAYGTFLSRKSNAVAIRNAVESFNGLYNGLYLGEALSEPKFESSLDLFLQYESSVKRRHFPMHPLVSYLPPSSTSLLSTI